MLTLVLVSSTQSHSQSQTGKLQNSRLLVLLSVQVCLKSLSMCEYEGRLHLNYFAVLSGLHGEEGERTEG